MANNLLRFSYGENNINTGPLKEIPEICVDHFVGADLNSSIFFLSHAHTDHLVGLETDEFMRRLGQPGIQLYCHHLTPILLGFFERYLGGAEGIEKLIAKRKIVPLDVEKPIKLRIPRRTGHLDVKVTLLSAGHCPGSVMFLFETSSFCLLHTGDYRLSLEDLKRMPYLHVNKAPKPIDHLYVDTTFCSKSADLFPNRKEVFQEALEKIRSWVTLSRQHIVYISFAARFAHEYVLLELFKTFQQKIHVTEERIQIYRHIPDLYKIVTLDDDTQFHLCNRKECDANENSNAITLRLSCMWYTIGKDDNREPITWNGSFLTLCYSMHSSLQEIGMTIDYLKPKIVTPLVLPKKSNLEEVREALTSVTTHQFKYTDYHSSRVDFEEDIIPAEPCREERDETDVFIDSHPKTGSQPESGNEIGSDKDPNSQNSNNSILDSPSSEPSSAKKTKVSWQYSLSPSSQSSSSQSSSDLSQSPCKAMDDILHEKINAKEDKFLRPFVPTPSTSSNSFCRNLTSALSDAKLSIPSKNTDDTIVNGTKRTIYNHGGDSKMPCVVNSADTDTTYCDIDDDDITMNSQPLL